MGLKKVFVCLVLRLGTEKFNLDSKIRQSIWPFSNLKIKERSNFILLVSNGSRFKRANLFGLKDAVEFL